MNKCLINDYIQTLLTAIQIYPATDRDTKLQENTPPLAAKIRVLPHLQQIVQETNTTTVITKRSKGQ